MSAPPVKDEPAQLAQPATEISQPLSPSHARPVTNVPDAAGSLTGSESTGKPITQSRAVYDAVRDDHGDAPLPGGYSPVSLAGEDEFCHIGSDLEEVEDDWEDEDESMYEMALDGLSDEALRAQKTPDACTLDEALEYRKLLRKLGKEQFVDETLFAGKITAKKLCTAFGILPPAILEGADDENFYGLLNLGIERELRKRQKLRQYNSVDDAVALIQKSRNIIVVTGAGISTSLGIPDFRSSGTGFYDRLAANGLTDRISEPSEVFDLHVFKTDPDIFFSVAGDILPPEGSTGKPQFTPTHAFIKLLEDQGHLLTNYTQNIDNIESYAGISKDKIIQCHGSFATATCQKCHYQVQGETIFPQIRSKQIAYCPKCEASLKENADTQSSLKRKRSSSKEPPKTKRQRPTSPYSSSSDSDSSSIPQPGIMKPDITFFGEDLPETFHSRIATDQHTVDLVIVIGTSLKVDPVASIPSVLDPDIPQIYISKSRCSHIDFDIEFNGDCDVVLAELARRLGWGLGHEMISGVAAKIETPEEEGFRHRHMMFEGKENGEDVGGDEKKDGVDGTTQI